MKLRWVDCPCKDCTDRHAGCHGSCEGYKNFKTEHDAETKRLWEEDNVTRQVYDINRNGAEAKQRPEPLKHGRGKRK